MRGFASGENGGGIGGGVGGESVVEKWRLFPNSSVVEQVGTGMQDLVSELVSWLPLQIATHWSTCGSKNSPYSQGCVDTTHCEFTRRNPCMQYEQTEAFGRHS